MHCDGVPRSVTARATASREKKSNSRSRIRDTEEAETTLQPPRKSWAPSWVPWWGWDGSYDDDMGTLEAALSAQGLPPQKVMLKPVPEGDRGLVTRQAIGKGDRLLDIPESLLITMDTVRDELCATGSSPSPDNPSKFIPIQDTCVRLSM